MPRKKPSFLALRDLLAEVYADAPSARRVAGDAGMDLRHVEFSGRAIDTWDSILTVAKHQGLATELLNRVLKEYGSEPNLPKKIYDYYRDYGVLLQPSESPSHGKRIWPDWDVTTDDWLSLHGFIGNPFIDTEADRENRGPLFNKYQVEPPLYDRVVGDAKHSQTIVIGSGRGWGKSTFRIMISQACRPQNKESPILAIEYAEFDRLGEVVEELSPEEVLRFHLTSVLRNATESLVNFLVFGDNLNLPRLPVRFFRLLKWFWSEYGSDSQRESKYYERLANAMPATTVGHTSELSRAKFNRAWRARNLSKKLKRTHLWNYAGMQIFANLVDAEPADIQPDQIGPTRLFAKFVELVQTTGLACMYVLVDRTDESQTLAGRPDRICRMLSPLLTELPLMETPGSAFKFFLPLPAAQELINYPGVRTDRIPFLSPQWTEDKLHEMLGRRLSVFSDGAVTTIDQLCELDFQDSIEKNLIRAARGVPRNLLRIANQLIIEHCYHNKDKLLIQRQDWEQTNLVIEMSGKFTE